MSGMVSWSESLSVGVESIDIDHQGLVSMLNRAFAACEPEGCEEEEVGPLIEDLISYVGDHFTREEGYMVHIDYPHLEAHRAKHREMAGRVLEMQERYRGGEETLGREILVFLSVWLVEHIQGADQAFADYGRQRAKRFLGSLGGAHPVTG